MIATKTYTVSDGEMVLTLSKIMADVTDPGLPSFRNKTKDSQATVYGPTGRLLKGAAIFIIIY